eukprot:Colp12_sorted_trinity150504_noHs@28325
MQASSNKGTQESLPIYGFPSSFFDKAVLFGASQKENAVEEGVASVVSSLSAFSCSTCRASFPSLDVQREHYKTFWHTSNVQRKSSQLPPLSESEFSELKSAPQTSKQDDDKSDSDDDLYYELQGLSVDDEGDENEETTDTPKSVQGLIPLVYFTTPEEAGKVYAAKTCVLWKGRKQRLFEDELRIASIRGLSKIKSCAVLMLSAGHFAGGIFENGAVTHHKTFHRYVVRAKRGGAQSAHDAAGRKAKSAGANLRRYNELALQEDIRGLLQGEWAGALKACDVVFVYAPGSNRKTLYGDGRADAPLDKDDPRVRHIPYAVKRPTYENVVKVYNALISIDQLTDLQVSELLEQQQKQAKAKIFPSLRIADAVPLH